MKKWEAALDKFLKPYIHQPWFEGALLSGSYACGNQNRFSDIDVTIIGSNDLNWQEKSNCYVDGFLIEYIINPIWRFEKYMDESLKDHDYTSQNLILYGKILFDCHGEIKKLQKKALAQIQKPFEPISDYDKSFIKYYLWDRYDELQSLYHKKLHIDLQYWLLVDALISAYYDFCNLPHIPHSKIELILNDKDFAERYHIKKMPEKAFCDKLMLCFKARNNKQKLSAVRKFYDYVLDVGGGFDIGSFRGKRTLK